MQICLCDDEKLQRELLQRTIELYFISSYTECDIKAYSTGNALFEDFTEHFISPDIIFMDILLPGTNGFDVSLRLRENGYLGDFVFVSSSSDYATRGYEVDARAYIVKPYDPYLISKTLNRIIENPQINAITITKRDKILRIPIDEIMYIESRNQKCYIHCIKGMTHSVYNKLDDLEHAINNDHFLRCHKSFLVNMEHITIAGSDFILKDGSKVPIRQKERAKFKKNFLDYMETIVDNTKCNPSEPTTAPNGSRKI